MIMTAVVPRFFGGGIGVAIYRTAPCFLPLTTSKAEGAHNAIAVLRARERKTAGSISARRFLLLGTPESLWGVWGSKFRPALPLRSPWLRLSAAPWVKGEPDNKRNG